MNKAVLSIWVKGFNGLKDGRKLEGIVTSSDLKSFLNTIHYGKENIKVEDTSLPITHISIEDGFFRKVG